MMKGWSSKSSMAIVSACGQRMPRRERGEQRLGDDAHRASSGRAIGGRSSPASIWPERQRLELVAW